MGPWSWCPEQHCAVFISLLYEQYLPSASVRWEVSVRERDLASICMQFQTSI